jgi:predicted RNA binding protein YcfA (HicA-like mRNA interferase family)
MLSVSRRSSATKNSGTQKANRDAGFLERQAKGSHTVWYFPNTPIRVTISGNDGADAKKYLEDDVRRKIALLLPLRRQS